MKRKKQGFFKVYDNHVISDYMRKKEHFFKEYDDYLIYTEYIRYNDTSVIFRESEGCIEIVGMFHGDTQGMTEKEVLYFVEKNGKLVFRYD